MSALLDLRGVTKRFGALTAVRDVTFQLAPEARHALIGPNGAGKSTLLQLITGHLRPDAGTVLFDGGDVTRLPEYRRARLGATQTFQHSRLFISMSAIDNIVIALHRARPRQEILRPRRWRALADEAYDILEAVGLGDKPRATVSALSHGERRQLEVGVALARRPRLLLLDEPAAGMSAHESGRFAELMKGLPRDVTFLFVEHDLDLVFELASTVTVLHLGSLIADGPVEEVRNMDAVQEAYLGGAHTDDLFIHDSAESAG